MELDRGVDTFGAATFCISFKPPEEIDAWPLSESHEDYTFRLFLLLVGVNRTLFSTISTIRSTTITSITAIAIIATIAIITAITSITAITVIAVITAITAITIITIIMRITHRFP